MQLPQDVSPQLFSLRRERLVFHCVVTKGGAGFASKDNPLVHVILLCIACLQHHRILSFSMERHGSVPACYLVSFQGCPPGSVLSPASALICAVPAGCQVQSRLLYCTFNLSFMYGKKCGVSHQSQGFGGRII